MSLLVLLTRHSHRTLAGAGRLTRHAVLRRQPLLLRPSISLVWFPGQLMADVGCSGVQLPPSNGSRNFVAATHSQFARGGIVTITTPWGTAASGFCLVMVFRLMQQRSSR